MKVTIIGTTWPYRGGLAAYNERLAREFIVQGHEVQIHTFSLQYPGFLFPGKTQLASWDQPEGLTIHQSINSVNPINWLTIGRRIARENPDLIIIKYWLPFMGPAFGTILRLAKKRGAKVISILDNIIPHEKRPGDGMFTRYFVGPVDAFIAQSQSVLDDSYQFDETKPRLLNPHPIFDNFGALEAKESARARIGIPAEAHYMLFFGFIRDYKGLDLVLKALADERIKKSGMKLIVAGEFYSNEETYMQLIEELGVADQVILKTEFIPDDQVAHYFNAADVVVQPYKNATQSGVTQIAYHFEKSMIVTNVGGLAEIVPDRVSGLICEPTVDSLANALDVYYTEALNDQLTQGAKGEKARFSWGKLIDSVMKLYQQIA